MKPTAFQIFCGYYLGLDSEFAPKFFNIHSLAAHYGIGPEELNRMMADHKMLPEDMRHVDFNVARAHAAAQDLIFEGTRTEIVDFARKAFEEFTNAAGGYDDTKVFEDVDYDNIFGDEPAEKNDDDACGNR